MNPLHHRGTSRSATATPTGSPKRRLPQIPMSAQSASRDRVSRSERLGSWIGKQSDPCHNQRSPKSNDPERTIV